jgi:hypothetical protein
MAATIILTRVGDRADAIVGRFADETGLTPERRDEDWVFPVSGDEHEIKVVQTLTGIDEHWSDHVGFREPDAA